MGFLALMNWLFITIYCVQVLRNGEMQVEMLRCRWAWVGLTDFFKILKNKGAHHQSCQRLSILTSNRDGEVMKCKRAGNFLIHFVWRDIFVHHRNMDRQDFFYPYYGQMPSTSHLQDLSQNPPHAYGARCSHRH